jgi:hypothetical protein
MLRNRLLPVALIAALVGGSVGAFVMHENNQPGTQASAGENTTRTADAQYVADNNGALPREFDTADEQIAYKAGFADGFRAAQAGVTGDQQTSSNVVNRTTTRRVVYRNAARTAPRRVYYNYNTQPRGRTFWQKHRDKLTVAMGTGGGALVGALIGGKKGAAIGALAGAGGSALYTYKLRDRSRRY